MDLLEFIRTFCTKLGTPSGVVNYKNLNLKKSELEKI